MNHRDPCRLGTWYKKDNCLIEVDLNATLPLTSSHSGQVSSLRSSSDIYKGCLGQEIGPAVVMEAGRVLASRSSHPSGETLNVFTQTIMHKYCERKKRGG